MNKAPELAEQKEMEEYRHSINLMLEYYGKRFSPQDTARLVAILSKADVLGLVKYAYEQGSTKAVTGAEKLCVA